MYLKNFKTSEFKKVVFILGILVFGLVFHIPANLRSEDTGFKYFKNYGYRDYEHQPQNWGIVQAESRIIYVANHGRMQVEFSRFFIHVPCLSGF